MGVFSKMMHALGAETDQQPQVRALLAEAHAAGVKITLQTDTVHRTMLMTSAIQQIREEDLIVTQPTIDGAIHQLAFGEPVTIRFSLGQRHYTGDSECLGRIRLEHAQSAVYAYRLSVPARFEFDRRVEISRPALVPSQQIEAQLYAPGVLKTPLQGRITELTMSGLSLTTGLVDGGVTVNQQVFLKAKMPDPVGLVDEVVQFISVQPNLQERCCVIGVKFLRRIDGLDTLIRSRSQSK